MNMVLNKQERIARLYKQLKATPWPSLAGSIGDLAFYDALLAGCASRVARGKYVDPQEVPCDDDETSKAVDNLRAKASISEAEKAVLDYFDLLEKLRSELLSAS